MTRERLIELLGQDIPGDWEGDNAYQGLQILRKYTANLICGADHDIIYSENIDQLIKAGITENDCKELRRLNWMVNDDEYLACFV